MASQTLALASGKALKFGLFLPAHVIFTGNNAVPSGLLPDAPGPELPTTAPPPHSSPPPPPPPPPPPQQTQTPTFVPAIPTAPSANVVGTASQPDNVPNRPNFIPSPSLGDDKDGPTITNIPLPSEFTSVAPFPVFSRTAVVVSSCQGSDSCVTIGGKTFSLIPTMSSTANNFAGSSGSAVSSAQIPTLTSQPLQVLDQRLSNAFSGSPLKIIIASTASYFLLAIFFVLGTFMYLRHSRKSRMRSTQGIHQVELVRMGVLEGREISMVESFGRVIDRPIV
ncbi:hypothetical protein GALMADRAFT_253814 [Galerina marginata CBS 339.88]|uniref:Uncharacterized protein n=1 Tax=Galerina marginata (strain CBS 339.88) TaxID=685588 RepID=A0A067SKQ6_GALM3|nr:hypothetical protein GALMADRAFT_253814 [Galerina marginata CBS 339.88]